MFVCCSLYVIACVLCLLVCGSLYLSAGLESGSSHEKGVTRHLACCSLLGVVNLEEIVSAGPHRIVVTSASTTTTHFGSTSSYLCDLQVRVVELEASLELPMVAEPVC